MQGKLSGAAWNLADPCSTSFLPLMEKLAERQL